MDIVRRTSMGVPRGEPIAEVVVRFYSASEPNRAIGAFEVIQSLAPSLVGRMPLVRHAISALLDEMEGQTLPVREQPPE